ncbi:unnamed protein product [Fraxinus pennsylvanica]|uniref:Uncharacterized protein n=1 Tax=Fraxinus pennsylvanica TaxID=56036 RepID=A0AAD2EEW1_9LAMI|nr:unnamed protein product [Fraxinus pennsylvanica]
MATVCHSPNFWGILSETKRIIRANSSNYLALSILFLLPLSFAFVLYPFIFSYSAPDPTIPSPQKSNLVIALYVFFMFLFSIFATGSITYSTVHGFYGRPVNYLSSIKSILFSFFPLLATFIAYQIVLFIIFYFIWLVGVVVYQYYEGVKSNYSLAFVVCMTILILVVTFYLQVEWSLAYVVVVVESKWGFESFKKSSHLIKGMKWITISLILYYAIVVGLLASTAYFGGINGGSGFIIQTLFAIFMTAQMLHCITAYTVLYMYCKVLHGEMAFEIAEESAAADYISLPIDGGQGCLAASDTSEKSTGSGGKKKGPAQLRLYNLGNTSPVPVSNLVSILERLLKVKAKRLIMKLPRNGDVHN